MSQFFVVKATLKDNMHCTQYFGPFVAVESARAWIAKVEDLPEWLPYDFQALPVRIPKS